MTFHRQSVLVPICLKSEFANISDTEVPLPPGPMCFLENAGRFFFLDSESGRHALALPQPFVIAPRWQPRKFLPFFASSEATPSLRLFFSLFDSGRYKQISSLYLTAPNWTPESHPYFQEPSEGEELGQLVRDLYGLETLFRISLVSHPTKEPLIFLYLATDQAVLSTPILHSSHRFQLDELIASAFRPFFAEGRGKIMCPLCLFQITDQHILPMFLSRSEFSSHYKAVHFQNSIVSGLFSPTQYHVRQYQAHCLWTLCLPYRNFRDGSPEASPTDAEVMDSYSLGVSHHLAVLFPGSKSARESHDPKKVPSSVSFGLPDEVLAEMVQSGTIDLQAVISHSLSPESVNQSRSEDSNPSLSERVLSPEDPFPPLQSKSSHRSDPRRK